MTKILTGMDSIIEDFMITSSLQLIKTHLEEGGDTQIYEENIPMGNIGYYRSSGAPSLLLAEAATSEAATSKTYALG